MPKDMSMKKSITLLALAAALAFAVPSRAGLLQFGLKGGLNNSRMSFNRHDWYTSSRSGWFIGPSMRVKVPDFGLGLDVSVLYDQREAGMYSGSTSRYSGEARYKEKTFSIPINLRYDLELGSFFGVYVAAGPEFSFNIDRRTRFYEDEWNMRPSRIGINVGLGIMLVDHLQLGANYNIATGHTGEAEVWGEGLKARSNTWQISLGYYF